MTNDAATGARLASASEWRVIVARYVTVKAWPTVLKGAYLVNNLPM